MAVGLAFAAFLVIAAPARAASGGWDRAWGKDVDTAGGTGFEVCTVAASCKQGLTGALGGEFDFPFGGVGADPGGNVYVVDRNNQRIQKFDPTGNFLRAWGRDVVTGGGTDFEVCTVAANCQAGFGGAGLGGDLNFPFGVAADAAGNVYVAEIERIQKFDSSGNWERAWGKDVVAGGGTGFEVCTVAANCQFGTPGAQGGEFNVANGVAADAAGNVYVVDQNNDRIQRFDSSGNFLRAWGRDVVTGGGTGFEVCTVAASCQAGATGGLGGEFDIPFGVAADAAGNVYVADNGRIEKFDSSGNFLRAWGRDVVAGGGTGFEVCTVAASCKPALAGVEGGELTFPTAVAADAAGNVYVADDSNQRIQKFDSSGGWQLAWGRDVDAGGGTGFEVCTMAVSCKAGAAGGLGGELNDPRGVAADAAGNVYVADLLNQRIQKYAGQPATPTPAAPSATCRGKQATMVGTNGSDHISGTPGADVIIGLDGDDTLSGLGGKDVICGAKGNDTLKGGKGKDILLGQKGGDKLKGDGGNDKLSGKKGKDTLKGGGGKDTLKGGGGKDVCIGGKANDKASKCEVEKSI